MSLRTGQGQGLTSLLRGTFRDSEDAYLVIFNRKLADSPPGTDISTNIVLSVEL